MKIGFNNDRYSDKKLSWRGDEFAIFLYKQESETASNSHMQTHLLICSFLFGIVGCYSKDLVVGNADLI